jgi:hypothetical protein
MIGFALAWATYQLPINSDSPIRYAKRNRRLFFLLLREAMMIRWNPHPDVGNCHEIFRLAHYSTMDNNKKQQQTILSSLDEWTIHP